MKQILVGLFFVAMSPMLLQAQLIDNFSDGELSLLVTDLQGETVVQNGLSVVGGSREVYAGTLELGSLNINATEQSFIFEAGESFGYFALRYGGTTPLEMDLVESGATAIQLDFASVTPGLRRGLYEVALESPNARVTQSYSRQLFALSGSGQIVLPLSEFRSDFGVIDFSNISKIQVSASRVEPTYQLVLNSVTAVPTQLGDVNLDSMVNFLDISAFIAVLSGDLFQAEADCDENGMVDFDDIAPFIAILSGS